MVTRRERREARARLGEALVTGGLIVLVGAPIVYGLHAKSMHVRSTRAWWWPTAWMIVPLIVIVIGGLLSATPNGFRSRARASARRGPAVDRGTPPRRQVA